MEKDIAVIYVRESSAKVLLWEFYSVQPHIYVSLTCLSLFLCGPKGYMHLNVQCSTVYNSQDVEAT